MDVMTWQVNQKRQFVVTYFNQINLAGFANDPLKLISKFQFLPHSITGAQDTV